MEVIYNDRAIHSDQEGQYLVTAAGERAALHRARVVIAGVAELHTRRGRVQLVQHGRKPPPQCQKPVPGVVESHTHAALVGRCAAVMQQTADHRHTNIHMTTILR